MTQEAIPVHYAALATWYDRLGENATIKHVNQELAKIVTEHDLVK